MNIKELKRLMKVNPVLNNHISIGYRNGYYCLTKPILKNEYYVILDDQGLRIHEKSFKNEKEACEHLLEVSGVKKFLK